MAPQKVWIISLRRSTTIGALLSSAGPAALPASHLAVLAQPNAVVCPTYEMSGRETLRPAASLRNARLRNLAV